MKNLKCQIHCCLVCLILLPSFYIISCNPDNSGKIIAWTFSNIDDSIYVNEFPSDAYLNLGKSVLFKNAYTVFRFLEVLEYTTDNSAVRLEVDYGYGNIKTIILNTKNIPQNYYLENGYNYDIKLKEVNQINNNTYQIIFTLNEYGTGFFTCVM